MGSTRTSRVGAPPGSRVTVVGRHPVHAGKRHGAVAFDPEVNGKSAEGRLVLAPPPWWAVARLERACPTLRFCDSP